MHKQAALDLWHAGRRTSAGTVHQPGPPLPGFLALQPHCRVRKQAGEVSASSQAMQHTVRGGSVTRGSSVVRARRQPLSLQGMPDLLLHITPGSGPLGLVGEA